MDLIDELREAGEASDLESFRLDLLDAVAARAPEGSPSEERDFAFVCEVGSRLSEAEEFQDFIPCGAIGKGHRGRNLRVDGYELDEADDSIRLLIAEFSGDEKLETITKTRAEIVFSQLKAFLEESASGNIWNTTLGESAETRELASLIEQKHLKKPDQARSVTRYRLYLITDLALSDRVKDLQNSDMDGVPIEFHIWDVGRLKAVSSSILGTEELEIDFTQFSQDGLLCLRASETPEYDGYLCTIPGDILAQLYDKFGSKLLEGNVRSFLSANRGVNLQIQKTIRAEPSNFFVYNNGISATATSAEVKETASGLRLISAKYLQIVNGGQTTASLNAAKKKDNADLSLIHVPMKLSVVKTRNTEMLDAMIQNIARASNSQNKVNEADFFSNHPFHRAIERHARAIKAPAAEGAQFNTHWFYERARGQYINEQSKMNLPQRRAFLRENPRGQLIIKTDLAKYENSWRQLPHIVSRHAQKNFKNFAEYIGKEYGMDGRKFDNEIYFKSMVAKAISFKFVERMVSSAKDTWYNGDYRAQIVTYTIAKLQSAVEEQAPGRVLNFMRIWQKQAISAALGKQLEAIAKVVSIAITTPPVAQMNIGEWCKKEDCWLKVNDLSTPLSTEFRAELISKSEAEEAQAEANNRAGEDAVINEVVEVVRLEGIGCWKRLLEWSSKYSPIYAKEADLVRNASRRGWIPSDRQAAVLMKVLRRLEQEGFTRS